MNWEDHVRINEYDYKKDCKEFEKLKGKMKPQIEFPKWFKR